MTLRHWNKLLRKGISAHQESAKPELGTTVTKDVLYLCAGILVSPVSGENVSDVHFVFLGCKV